MNDQKGTIILISMATFLFFTITLSIIGYLISFTKKEFKVRFINKKVLILLFIVLGVNLFSIIIDFLFQFIINFYSNTLLIVAIIVTFSLTIGVGIYLFLFLQTIVIGIDEKEIVFLGERILINKIISIESDNKTNKLIINYIEGTSNKKKCRFSLVNKSGKFIINNVDLLNQEIVMFISK